MDAAVLHLVRLTGLGLLDWPGQTGEQVVVVAGIRQLFIDRRPDPVYHHVPRLTPARRPLRRRPSPPRAAPRGLLRYGTPWPAPRWPRYGALRPGPRLRRRLGPGRDQPVRRRRLRHK